MMAETEPEGRFLSERRALGLLGAAVLATAAYGVVTVYLFDNPFDLLRWVIFFVVFALLFTALNYAVWRYD